MENTRRVRYLTESELQEATQRMIDDINEPETGPVPEDFSGES